MNTTSTILAIDLGKHNSVSCHYVPETRAQRSTRFARRPTPDEMRRLLARVPVVLVVIEACSGAGWVTDLTVDVPPRGRGQHGGLRLDGWAIKGDKANAVA